MTDSLGRHSISDVTRFDRLAGASVNADAILEPAWPDPRPSVPLAPDPGSTAAPVPAPSQPPDSVTPIPPAALPAFAVRRLTLVPVAGLHWGATGRLAAPGGTSPRVRGDHALIHLCGGGITIGLPAGARVLTGDQLVLVPAGTAFSLRAGTNALGWLLLIPTALAAGFPQGLCCGTPSAPDSALLRQLVPALAGTDAAARPDAALLAGPLSQLRAVLDRLTAPAPTMPPQTGDLSQARALAARFLELLDQDLSQGQTIADYARRLGCSLALLDQACRDSRGRSALDLLYRLRLDRAAALLRDTETPAAQIALDLGFSSLGHFTRVFGAATGTAPDSFRARCHRA